jgi:hypothetical protein
MRFSYTDDCYLQAAIQAAQHFLATPAPSHLFRKSSITNPFCPNSSRACLENNR